MGPDLAPASRLGVLLSFHFRFFLLASLCGFWKSLEYDVNTFCLRHFFPPPSHVLPPGMTAISADDVDALNRFADAIFEQRNKTIIDYTEAIRCRNRNTNQRELSKEDVTEQFTACSASRVSTNGARMF